jgi:hypothetical protein
MERMLTFWNAVTFEILALTYPPGLSFGRPIYLSV